MIKCDFIPLRKINKMSFTEGAEKIRIVPNAGGNSVISEILSFELLNRCFGAVLIKTEMEVSYFPYGGSITDYVCSIYGPKLGVSVTRAMKYRGHYNIDDALRLLNKKLKGVIQSSSNSQEKWNKQIVHVWATSQHVADIISRAYEIISDDVKVNTLVLVTTASHSDFIFENG